MLGGHYGRLRGAAGHYGRLVGTMGSWRHCGNLGDLQLAGGSEGGRPWVGSRPWPIVKKHWCKFFTGGPGYRNVISNIVNFGPGS